jgi:ketosteroid isomerase-like protein
VDQEKAKRLADLPLDEKQMKYTFDLGADGAGITMSPRDSDPDLGEHLGWRQHRLAQDAARCDFSAPEFGNVASSQEAKTLCNPRPMLRVVSNGVSNGFYLEIKSSSPERVPQIQKLVRLIAERHPGRAISEMSETPGSVERAREIIHLEERWAQAAKTGDAATVDPMLAETFITTDVSGHSYNKVDLLANLKGGKWESNGISDVMVKFYGDTAIATGAWAGKGVDGDGTRIDRHERWTDTWVKTEAGQWQCVASHASEVR